MRPPFDSFGVPGATPVVVSVPHAGRDYPVDIEAALAVPVMRLVGLEDRHADTLAEALIADRHHVIVARAPRLLVDLNRAEDELDAAMAAPGAAVSARARGGLGVVPTRLAGVGEIWRTLPTDNDVAARLALVHRPYHLAIARAVDTACARWGFAVLVDLHSMPSLAGPGAAQIVLGDRHGTSAAGMVTAAAQTACMRAGFRTRRNDPYAGGYIVARHGRPSHRVHALQIEIDRRCYLDRAQLHPTPARHRVAAMLADAAARIVEALSPPIALAAE